MVTLHSSSLLPEKEKKRRGEKGNSGEERERKRVKTKPEEGGLSQRGEGEEMQFEEKRRTEGCRREE